MQLTEKSELVWVEFAARVDQQSAREEGGESGDRIMIKSGVVANDEE